MLNADPSVPNFTASTSGAYGQQPNGVPFTVVDVSDPVATDTKAAG